MTTEEIRRKEYFDRTLAVRPTILADDQIVSNIKNIFDFHEEKYEGPIIEDKGDKGRLNRRPEGTLYLGSGEIHEVYGIGNIIHPKDKNRRLHLALKINARWWDINSKNILLESALAENISAYEDVFTERDHIPKHYFSSIIGEINSETREVLAPYFVGAVKYGSKGGLLTEDITEGKNLRLRWIDYRRFTKPNPDGTESIYLLTVNAVNMYRGDHGNKYLAKDTIFDLGEK